MARNRKKMLSPELPIYLFVEGEKSEPVYFELFRKELGISGLKIYPTKGKSGNALLLAAKNQIKLKNLRSDALKCLVFDKDALTDWELTAVFEKAETEGFKIGFSNSSFELRGLVAGAF